MSWSHVTVCPSTSARLAILFCLFWPFVTLSLMPKRGRSAGPLAAMAVPIAVTMVAMWLGFHMTLRGMALSGAGPASTSAGIAESLSLLTIGAGCAGVVAFLALLRRHRTYVDRGIAMLYAFLFVELTGALLLGANIGMDRSQFTLCIVGAIVAGIVAIVGVGYAWLAGRGRLTAAPLPFGVPLLAALCIIAAIAVRQQVGHYRGIAIGRSAQRDARMAEHLAEMGGVPFREDLGIANASRERKAGRKIVR